MTETTSTGELSDEQIVYVREYITGCICDDMDDAVDFISGRDDIEMSVSEKVNTLSESELCGIAEDYAGCGIEDIINIGD